MKGKSDRTLTAAQELINKRFFTQSVHCSYYSVRQLMQYKLAHIDRPMSYEQQEARFRGKDSHEELLSEIVNRISNYREKGQFREDFRLLKKQRTLADYQQKIFTEDEGTSSKQLAEHLRSKLNYFFHTEE